MRGKSNPPTAGERTLSQDARNAAAASVILLLIVMATGASASPLLPLFLGAIIALIRYIDRPMVLLAPPAAALAVLAATAIVDEVGLRALVAAGAIMVATFPGLLWRREARRSAARLAKLDTALMQVSRGRPSESADVDGEAADLELALRAVASRLGARAVLVWDVDSYHGTARIRASASTRSAGYGRLSGDRLSLSGDRVSGDRVPLSGDRVRLSGDRVRLSGDPMGWVWDQGTRLRIERPPQWSDPGLIAWAERLRRYDDYGEIITYAFEPGHEPDDMSLDEAAIYVRGIMGLQEARADASSVQRRLNSLAAGLRAIPGTLELESLANDLCMTAISITGASGAAIASWDGERGEILGAAGSDGGPKVGDSFAAPESELALAIIAGAMIVRTADDWSLGRSSLAHSRETWETRPRAMAALPLRGAAGNVGVLAVWTSSSRSLDPAGLELLHALSPYAALHLQHADSYGRIRETAERDPLTLLRNRRAFDVVFAAERMRFERYRRPISLLMLDVDHFKGVNDRYGHEAGDEVLRRIAALVTSCIRDVDTAARFGGEEVVVLLPETALTAAIEVAERIRSTIEGEPMAVSGGPISVSVSVGVSTCPERVAEPADLLGSADEALYRAKAAGRNRTEMGR
ncbi:hypothetical protein BH23GEM9_BH23GEM9_14340 [soil metagenome]